MKIYLKHLFCVLVVVLSVHSVRGQCTSYSLTKENKTDTATAYVHGKVYDPWGHPVAFVTVKVGPYRAQADEQGNFSLPAIQKGKYNVEVVGYCHPIKKWVKLKTGQAYLLTIYTPKRDEHLPGLGKPRKK